MPNPNIQHINQALTNLSLKHGQNECIADKFALTIPVRKKSDDIFTFDRARRDIAIHDIKIPVNGIPNETDYTIDHDETYTCKGYGLRHTITAEDYANFDLPIVPETDAVLDLTNKLNTAKEYSLVSKLKTALAARKITLDGQELDGSNELNTGNVKRYFNDPKGDPIIFIDAMIEKIRSEIGYTPNRLVIPYRAFKITRNHPSFLKRITYQGNDANPAKYTAEAMAKVFGLDEVIVPEAYVNTAAEGSATPTIEEIWGNNIFLGYIPNTATMKTMSLVVTPTWDVAKYNDAGGMILGASAGTNYGGWIVRKFPDMRTQDGAQIIDVKRYYDQKILAPACGFWIENVVGEVPAA